MKRTLKSLAFASFALLSFFSCSSLSAQTDALVVNDTGNVGVGTARPNIPQIRGTVARIMPHYPIFRGQTHDLLRGTGNMLLFGQPDTPTLLQILLANAEGNRTFYLDDFVSTRDTFFLHNKDHRPDKNAYEPSGASPHDN